MLEDGDNIYTPAGDDRTAEAPYFLRYELLKDVGIEDDEIKPVLQGDDFD